MSIYTPTGIKKYYHQGKRFLAKHWLSLWHPTQIAITGSQGKTNTTHIVTAVLSQKGATTQTDLTLDTTFNVPMTALRVTPWTKYLVWELGIDHPGEMDQHLEIVQPSIACITGISPVHTDAEHMGSLETLIQEKRKLIEVLPANGIAVLNHDDAHVQAMAEHTRAQVKWYGTHEGLDMWVDPGSIQVTLSGTTATIHNSSGLHPEVTHIRTGLIGTHHMHNIMAAYLICQSAKPNLNIRDIFTETVSQLKPLRGRMSIEKGPLGTILLDDSLRANPASTHAGLDTLARIDYKIGRKIAVIGEMGELEEPEQEHRNTGKHIAALNLDFIIGIGPLRKYSIDEAVNKGFPVEKTAYAADVFEAANVLKKILKKNDLWYLKGSLLRNYKRIVQLLNGEEVCCKEVLCPYDHCGYDN